MQMIRDLYRRPSDSGKRRNDIANEGSLADVLRLATDHDQRHNGRTTFPFFA